MATQRERILALLDAARANFESIRAEVEKAFPDPNNPPPPPDPSQQTVKVKVGDDVQRAFESILDAGGVLALAPGEHIVDLKIPARAPTSPLITFTSDSQDLPAPGTRIDPSFKPALAILRRHHPSRTSTHHDDVEAHVDVVAVRIGQHDDEPVGVVNGTSSKRAVEAGRDLGPGRRFAGRGHGAHRHIPGEDHVVHPGQGMAIAVRCLNVVGKQAALVGALVRVHSQGAVARSLNGEPIDSDRQQRRVGDASLDRVNQRVAAAGVSKNAMRRVPNSASITCGSIRKRTPAWRSRAIWVSKLKTS